MDKSTDTFTIADDAPGVGQVIETELLRSLRGVLPQGQNTSFVLSARDQDGALIGGLTASTAYGWLLIKCLWVAENHRNMGLGKSLMDCAEGKARDIGCHGAWLDTSSPDAMQFYFRLGYVAFGQLANSAGQHPDTHCRRFMNKVFQ